MSRVLVVGSVNMDLVVATETFPRPGETLLGTAFALHPGGKGANQAVAAARLGASVCFIGRVAADSFGQQLLRGLEAEGIDLHWLSRTAGATTGVATITVVGGENAIIVVPGANALLTPGDLDAAESVFAEADVVLAQLEVPLATVEHAALLAARHSKPFILNPAPAQRLPQSLVERCALLTPNEHELGVALAQPQAPWQDVLVGAPTRIALTKGAEGAYFNDAAGALHHQPSFPVRMVDTTGAGDTFNGAVAAFWELGLPEAIRRGCASGALSVGKAGAQGGMPTLAELEAFLAERR